MDILGKVKELVELIFQKDNQDITVKPSSSATYTAATTVELPNDASTTQELANTSGAQTLTNKNINADTNTISELETDNLKAGVLNTDTGLAGASDTQVPSALATKTYVDDAIATKDEASEISYDNTTSGLTATDVQAAIDEVDAQVDTNTSDISTNATNLTNHEADTSTHGVGEIVGTIEAATLTTKTIVVADNTITTAESGNLTSTELNAALAELQTDIDTRATDSDLTTHVGDLANPHAVTATQVGLGNVDNTSDLDKPISTATQSALDAKADETITISGDESSTTGGGDLTANRTITLRDNPTIPGTGYMAVPSGTTAQRPGTPTNNLIRHNSDENALETYDGTEWTSLGGGGLEEVIVTADPATAEAGTSYLIDAAFSTFTLPAIGGDGEVIQLKRGESSDFDGTPMTINPDGSDTIDSDTSLEWDSAKIDLIILTANGTNWVVSTTISPSAVISGGDGGGGLTQREAATNPSPAAQVNSSYLITGSYSTFTLPGITADGEVIELKRGAGSDFDGTPMTVTPNGADTVGGDATLVWDDADVDLIILTSNGTDWEVTTTISPSAVIGTPAEYKTEVHDSASNQWATGAQVRFTKIGNMVTITSDGVNGIPFTSSLTLQATSAGFIPIDYRPTSTITVATRQNAASGTMDGDLKIESNGTMTFSFNTSRSNTQNNFTISYVIV